MRNRIISILISVVLALNLFMINGVNVSAATQRTYKGEGYTVTYTGEGKKASVTLTNTGKSSIRNWALQFDGTCSAFIRYIKETAGEQKNLAYGVRAALIRAMNENIDYLRKC